MPHPLTSARNFSSDLSSPPAGSLLLQFSAWPGLDLPPPFRDAPLRRHRLNVLPTAAEGATGVGAASFILAALADCRDRQSSLKSNPFSAV
jgi:hypothetical protein